MRRLGLQIILSKLAARGKPAAQPNPIYILALS